ncbi:Fis family transcriptional regulator [Pseudoalteromonas sp. C2R02]|uniref:Fis family transcriptional regulator n=1 Tax=Pseudoalteromonas sp. C2R02 TaxID=2841565 RepID=UPI001C09113E|nr:Fis family transcriptional regulator [Pseudoalteromonas sp. C2R02]MBU2969414.1 Fis family transcriptional regulator [Pseudoalteromonas sp. C2R02]
MRKTDKKIDNNIRNVLNQACEQALIEVDGFVWLTHQVNYDKFPASLSIVCVFELNDDLIQAKSSSLDVFLVDLIVKKLAPLKIKIKPEKQIIFDTEENCADEHSGNWQLRLRT